MSDAGTLRSTKKLLRTVNDAVVWPAKVSAPVMPRAVMRYSDNADGALNVTRALPSLPVTTTWVPVGGLDEALAGFNLGCLGLFESNREHLRCGFWNDSPKLYAFLSDALLPAARSPSSAPLSSRFAA